MRIIIRRVIDARDYLGPPRKRRRRRRRRHAYFR
jgi:hypothetical protein